MNVSIPDTSARVAVTKDEFDDAFRPPMCAMNKAQDDILKGRHNVKERKSLFLLGRVLHRAGMGYLPRKRGG